MKQLPDSKIYEQELIYMPYKDSQQKVLEIIISKAAKNGSLIDLMCGPGDLLGKIAEKRKDLYLEGMDLDKRYINFSKKKYPKIKFEVGDILKWKSNKKFDIAICTGSVHHIPYEKQELTIKTIASMAQPGGLVIISDCYIDDYKNETERKLAAAKLGYEYLAETTKNGAPEEVVAATIDILHNDVMKNEFKTSVEKRLPIFKKIFSKVEIIKTWPSEKTEYGDYIMVCTV